MTRLQSMVAGNCEGRIRSSNSLHVNKLVSLTRHFWALSSFRTWTLHNSHYSPHYQESALTNQLLSQTEDDRHERPIAYKKIILAYYSSTVKSFPVAYTVTLHVDLKLANDGSQWQHAERYCVLPSIFYIFALIYL